MRWSKRTLPGLVLTLMCAAPALAQVAGGPLEVSAGAGLFKYDVRAQREKGLAFTGSIGWRPAWWLAFEGAAAAGPAEQDTAPGLDHNFLYAGLDLRLNLRPPESRAVPYLLVGGGYGRSHGAGAALERGAATAGAGVLINAFHPRTYLRLQVRDVLFRERGQTQFSNHVAVTGGVHVALLGRFRDQDRDGVRDWLDRCPGTPFGATVDAHGCPSDPDRDSVVTGIDRCPDTPPGCRVDDAGCPVDSDGDGVCDGLDQCADTPRGCTVNAAGCPSDADGDNVCDGRDTCADTPRGCAVDSVGCSSDADGDRICDTIDECPNTPLGTPVSPNGCPSVMGAFERQLLEQGLARVRGIVFDASGQTVAPVSHATLDSAGAVFAQLPTLKIEIGGPTDVTGEAGVRERLSLDQARAVFNLMKEKHPAIVPGNFTFRGYAAQAAGAPTPEAQRLRGRRVEFKVLNPEALPEERAKRGLTGP